MTSRWLRGLFRERRIGINNFQIRKYWSEEFEMSLFPEQVWLALVDCSAEVRLRGLHWKILHGIYPTNVLLKRIGVTDTDLCKTCV